MKSLNLSRCVCGGGGGGGGGVRAVMVDENLKINAKCACVRGLLNLSTNLTVAPCLLLMFFLVSPHNSTMFPVYSDR